MSAEAVRVPVKTVVVRLHEIHEGGLTLTLEVDPGGWNLEGNGLVIDGWVSLRLQFIRQGVEVSVFGSVSAEGWVECSLCLARHKIPLSSEVDAWFVPASGGIRSREGFDPFLYRREAIVLDELITGQLLLAVPMRSLCRPDCLGLCPQCGEDRNQVSCGCSTEDSMVQTQLRELKGRFNGQSKT